MDSPADIPNLPQLVSLLTGMVQAQQQIIFSLIATHPDPRALADALSARTEAASALWLHVPLPDDSQVALESTLSAAQQAIARRA